MLDPVFVALVVAFFAAMLVLTRSASRTAVISAFALGLSGTIVQSAATFDVLWTRTSLEVWAIGSMLATLAITWWQGRSAPRRPAYRPGLLAIVGWAVALLVMLSVVRLVAPSGMLQSVGYLITQPVGEDNAKWLNTSAHLATGGGIDTFAAVGGPLLLVMSFAAAITATLSMITLGGVNEVAVSANTVLVSQMLLIVSAPFALAPLFERRLTWWTDSGERLRARLPIVLGSIGVMLVAGASILVTQYGHLTLQFVLLSLALWTAVFALNMRSTGAFVLTTLTVAMTAQVWFPLGVVTLVLLAGLVVWGVVRARRPGPLRGPAIVTAVAAVVIGLLMESFLRSSIAFSLGTSSSEEATASAPLQTIGGAARGVVAAIRVVGDSTLTIFTNPGGTEVASVTMVALLVISLLAAFPLLTRGRTRLAAAAPFLPVIVLLGFTSVVMLLDFWSTGRGPNYASNKMLFASTIPILAVFVPIAIMRLDSAQKRVTAGRWVAAIVIVFLLVADTFIPRAVARLKPAMFPTASGESPPYWSLAEVRDTADQPLASNPLGCVFLPQGAEKPSVITDGQLAYSCSRIMSGLSGVGPDAGAFVAWQLDEWLQNTQYWDYYAPALNSLPENVKDRNVILLGDDSEVVGLATLGSLLERYPADPDFER